MKLEVLRELGRGGMGYVQLAVREEGAFRRLYAIKRLRPELARTPGALVVFMDEARVAGLLHHPNVVRVLDVGADDIGPYMVMEYVDGLSLGRFVQACISLGESLPVPVVVQLLRDVSLGLRAAHEATDVHGAPLGLVHRDISPDNVLVGRDGIARLSDFGIAKAHGRLAATTQDALKGKRSYMAPEVLRFEKPSIASDLWSLGVVLFEVLAEERLYHGLDGPVRAMNDPPPDLLEWVPEAPPALVDLVFALLAKDPSDRPASAAEVVLALESILAEMTDEDTPLPIDILERVMPRSVDPTTTDTLSPGAAARRS